MPGAEVLSACTAESCEIHLPAGRPRPARGTGCAQAGFLAAGMLEFRRELWSRSLVERFKREPRDSRHSPGSPGSPGWVGGWSNRGLPGDHRAAITAEGHQRMSYETLTMLFHVAGGQRKGKHRALGAGWAHQSIRPRAAPPRCGTGSGPGPRRGDAAGA